jgi:hypothetical protein
MFSFFLASLLYLHFKISGIIINLYNISYKIIFYLIFLFKKVSLSRQDNNCEVDLSLKN